MTFNADHSTSPFEDVIALITWRHFCEWLNSVQRSLATTRFNVIKLWLLDSGTGELGFVDRGAGALIPVAFVPGVAHGLAFVTDHAVFGLSLPRKN